MFDRVKWDRERERERGGGGYFGTLMLNSLTLAIWSSKFTFNYIYHKLNHNKVRCIRSHCSKCVRPENTARSGINVTVFFKKEYLNLIAKLCTVSKISQAIIKLLKMFSPERICQFFSTGKLGDPSNRIPRICHAGKHLNCAQQWLVVGVRSTYYLTNEFSIN